MLDWYRHVSTAQDPLQAGNCVPLPMKKWRPCRPRPSFSGYRCTAPVRWSRTAASTLISGLAPGNFVWLAQYFLGQLVGWGLALPEETDSEVMALVAPAGDKGRATLQKLHRRISTPSFGEVRDSIEQVVCEPGVANELLTSL